MNTVVKKNCDTDEQHRQPGLRDGPDERLSGVDADGGKKHRETEISQHDVGRQRHGPEDRTGAAQLAEDKGDDQRSAADAECHGAHTGNRDRNEAEKNADNHAEAKRDIAEFGGSLDGVAEVAADFLFPVGRRQHSDPVAELQHQVGEGTRSAS